MTAKSPRKPKKAAIPPLLQKWQRNDIFEAIHAAALDPRTFDLNDSGTQVEIKHRWSTSIFIVRNDSGYYAGQKVVGDGAVWPYGPCGWQSLIPRVSVWLGEVKRDLETPDLWAELRRETKLLEAGSSKLIENTPFTPDEQKEIARRLDELAKYLKLTYSLSQAQMKALDEKVNYFIEASGRVGRKDWLNIFVGGIFGYILSAAVPTESARMMFVSSLRAIGLLYPELPMIE